MGFEELLVTHASPTLANMKPASLLSIANAENMETCMIKLEKSIGRISLRKLYPLPSLHGSWGILATRSPLMGNLNS